MSISKNLHLTPQDDLVKIMQDPHYSAQIGIPAYAAMAEIARRTEIQKSAQPQQAAQPSIAQQLIQQAHPGVAALPLPEHMFQEKSMAAGGIVAFDDGGEVKHYSGLDGISQVIDPLANLSLSDFTLPSFNIPSVESINASMDQVLHRKPKNKKLAEQAGSDLANQYINAPSIGPVPSMAQDPNATNPLLPLLQNQDRNTQAVKNKLKPTPPAPNAPVNDPRLQTVSEVGYDVPKVDVKTIEVPEGLKTLDYINQQKAAMAEAGVDPDFYKKQADKLAAEHEALKGDRSNAGWMALAKAGFGMAAGTSPFALKNIAEGATAGMDQYGRDLKDIKADEKQLRAADDKLAEAQYLQSKGDAQGALAAMRERENLIFNTKAKNVELQNQGAIEESRQKSERSKTMFTEEGATKRTQLQIAAQKAISAADNQSREKIANLTTALDLNKQQRANIDKVHDNAKAQVKLEIDGGATYTPDQIQARIDELVAGGLAQMGYNIPGVKAPVKAPASSLTPATKGSGADFRFGY